MKATDNEVRAVMKRDDWATCDHAGVGRQDHRCPTCGATMRRCCDSSVGMREHTATCHAYNTRSAQGRESDEAQA